VDKPAATRAPRARKRKAQRPFDFAQGRLSAVGGRGEEIQVPRGRDRISSKLSYAVPEALCLLPKPSHRWNGGLFYSVPRSGTGAYYLLCDLRASVV